MVGIDSYQVSLLCLVSSVVIWPKAIQNSREAAWGILLVGFLSERCPEHAGKPQFTLPSALDPISILGLST